MYGYLKESKPGIERSWNQTWVIFSKMSGRTVDSGHRCTSLYENISVPECRTRIVLIIIRDCFESK